MDVYHRKNISEKGLSSGGSINNLGYPEAEKESRVLHNGYIQQAAEGLKYCVYLQAKQINHETLLAITITSTNDTRDFLSLARQRCLTALQRGMML